MIKKGLEAIVGKRYVLDGEASLDAYSKDLSLREVKKVFDPQNILNPGKLCY